MLKTLSELKASNIANIAGVGADTDQFTAYINEACERLLDRGDWWATVVPINLCVKRGCVVLPRYVAVIREMKSCGGNVPIRNEWYEFANYDWYNSLLGEYWGWDWCCQNMVSKGLVPTHNTIFGAGRKVRAYAQCNADYGKTLTIMGTDNNGQPLMHRDENGKWQQGIVLTLQSPYAESDGYVSTIEAVLKDETQKPVTLYAYNVADAILEDLAVYEPSEINPAFRRYEFRSWAYRDSDGNERYRPVCALVKLQYVPAKYDTDFVAISCIPAIKFMVAAIRAEEGNDYETAEANSMKAIQALNFQLKNYSPGDQTTINYQIAGGCVVSPQ